MFGVLFWSLAILLLVAFRPKSKLNCITVAEAGKRGSAIAATFALALAVICVLPMGLSPI